MTPRKMLFAAAFGIAGAMVAQQALAADAAAGEKVFKQKCSVCHKIGPGASNFVGPNLTGLDGRAIASAEGYDYSDADKAKKAAGFVWNAQTFDKYITNPQADIPGTKMVFAGISKASDRENLWAYIASFKK